MASSTQRKAFFPLESPPMRLLHRAEIRRSPIFFIPVQIPDGYPCHQIKRPCRKAPMEHAVSGSIFIGLHGIRFDAERRTCYIVHPFTHAKDQDTCCQRGAKVHSDPSKCFIMRLCIPSPRRISPNFVVRSTMAPTAIPKPMSKYSHAISVVMKL